MVRLAKEDFACCSSFDIRTVGRKPVVGGIILAGLDLIGDRVIEVNVFSPGGLRDAERFGGVDYCDAIVRALDSTDLVDTA